MIRLSLFNMGSTLFRIGYTPILPQVNATTSRAFFANVIFDLKNQHRQINSDTLHLQSREVTPMTKCSIETCINESVARGLCGTHYHLEQMRTNPPCSREDCSKPRKSKGLCSAHYSEMKRQEPEDPTSVRCSEPSCEKASVVKGLCRKHYAQHRLVNKPPCTFDDCGSVQYSDGLCRAHYDSRRHQRLKNVEREKCSVEGCIRRVPNGTATLCTMHSSRLRRYGEVGIAESLIGIEGCSVEGCDGEHKAQGLCDLHYRRFMRTGDPLHVARVASWNGAICSVEDCGTKVESKGLCNRHYLRLRIHGDPLAGGAFRVREHSLYCSIDGCDREYAGLGYCSLHLKRFSAHGDPLVVIDRSSGTCSITNCEKAHIAKNFCQMHYRRWMKHGDPLYEENRPTECVVTDCIGRVIGHGYCQLHYTRVRKWGDPHYFQRVSNYRGALCSIEGCERKAKTRSWCELHYDRFSTHGDPMFSMWEIDMDVPTTLYRLFNEQSELLYVGISVRVEQRMYEHSQNKWWWLEVEHQVLTQCPTRREALELEELAIKGEKPKYNITHNLESSLLED